MSAPATPPGAPQGERADYSGLLAAMERSCGSCAGEGMVDSAAWTTWRRDYDALEEVRRAARVAAGHSPAGEMSWLVGGAPDGSLPRAPVAAERALRDHTHATLDHREPRRCTDCRGAGVQPTETGTRLIGFLVRHEFTRTGQMAEAGDRR
ncbi:hypothetical protein GCM10022226_46830 [Sphaerisporangium flaviroseum]|uniref:Uncharacterized protein n=1 Tax=Sphaerisporangium flaviroseum TaxID=509199 RepID=A0ABP7ILC3_9ACTN